MAYESEIIAAAARYGVDSHVALAVAQQESGRQQYWQSGPKKGQLKIGSAGEIGMRDGWRMCGAGTILSDHGSAMSMQFANEKERVAACEEFRKGKLGIVRTMCQECIDGHHVQSCKVPCFCICNEAGMKKKIRNTKKKAENASLRHIPQGGISE